MSAIKKPAEGSPDDGLSLTRAQWKREIDAGEWVKTEVPKPESTISTKTDDAIDHLEWLLSELRGNDKSLADAVRDVERIRSSIWVGQDLPNALNYLIETVNSFRFTVNQIAQILHGYPGGDK
jgi:hypothetical protein